MRLLELTLNTAAENVALDEALLHEAEATASRSEFLRIWESPSPIVVVGRASQVDQEVNRKACETRHIPIIRRTSGGNAIVAAPGCLMYALILSYERRPSLRIVAHAHRMVQQKFEAALGRLLPGVTAAGISDLALGKNRLFKFSGNSLRCRRNYCLYHGTLLHDMPLELISMLLKMPPRQPDYRRGRPHAEFVANVPCAAVDLRAALIEAWQPTSILTDWPQQTMRQLVAEKFGQVAWNFRH